MTSNMTMTAISICDFLKLIVKSTVEHYTEDFKLDIKIFKRYAKEAQETGKPVSMLWFCRSCGTYLCPEEDAYKKDTPMFITFKYYDEQEEEEARTIKAFLVTVTGMERQKPVGYITPINYADECDRIRRYAVPAEKVELVYDKGSLVQNRLQGIVLGHSGGKGQEHYQSQQGSKNFLQHRHRSFSFRRYRFSALTWCYNNTTKQNCQQIL